ncbi:MAG TPA: DUF1801 domain-containing protein [Anaerolineaceae bacterium]|nr:DUF1801 domain-containing protein [Anaerolineaceae bacterium]
MEDVIKTYIAKAALEVQDILRRVGELVLEVDPGLTQTLSYQMPTFKKHGKPILYFAAHKNHPGIYPTPPTIAQFVARLAGYKTSKGAIQIPYSMMLNEELIQYLLCFNLERLENR